MDQREGNVINTAQEALDYLLESWDIPHDLRPAVMNGIEAQLHAAVGDPYPVNVHPLKVQMETLTDEALGRRFRSFILEAEHGSWEGWDDDEERGVIERVLHDLALWLENY